MGPWREALLAASLQSHDQPVFSGASLQVTHFGHHIRELFQNLPYALGGSHQLGDLLGLTLIQHLHDTHHAKASHTFLLESFSYHKADG